MIGMASLVPLSFILRYLPKSIRYWYSLILGFILQCWVYRISILPVFLQNWIVFTLIKKKGPKCGWLVTIESMIYLSGYHIYDLFYNYGGYTMHAIALMMILVCKYSLLAYNIEDGSLPDDKVTDEQRQFRLK